MRRKSAKNKVPQEKLRPAVHPQDIQEEIPIKPHRTILERVRDHPINWFAGLLATVLGIYYPISDALSEPEILHSTAQTNDPFSARFSLHNPSFIFPMTAMRINCVLVRIQFGRNFGMAGIPINDLINPSIPAGKTIEYECPLHKALDDLSPILTATIKIETTFSTLGYKRTTESEVFNWDFVSRQWTKGEIVN